MYVYITWMHMMHITNLSHLYVHIHYYEGKQELLMFLLTQTWYCWILSPILWGPLNNYGKNISNIQCLLLIVSVSSHSPFEAWSESSRIFHDGAHVSFPLTQPVGVKCSCVSRLNGHWPHWGDKLSVLARTVLVTKMVWYYYIANYIVYNNNIIAIAGN